MAWRCGSRLDGGEVCRMGARREYAIAIAGVRGGERFDSHAPAVSYIHRAHISVARQLAETNDMQ
ncbi:hypothetical protein Q2941_46730 [Bradyrhizobium sp. UFLA05-153]|uniref:hypothetical protein n=1 Tax=Bradyrhizobium sp. Ec3.3 TaxID=189753 RepID=UPI0012EB3003|nr:hypothetical protein [Bradyrhizobium sp. Ec3.3]